MTFVDLCREHNIKDVAPFIGLSKLIVGEGKEGGKDHLPYEPSNGEKGILLLQKSLSSPADAYLIDEPELGMGNSYIDQCIRPKLSDLAKEHKIVVVATHNANIAVRTLPYQTIFRKYDKGVYYCQARRWAGSRRLGRKTNCGRFTLARHRPKARPQRAHIPGR